MKELSEHYTLIESAEDFEALKRNTYDDEWIRHYGTPSSYPCIVQVDPQLLSDCVYYYFLYEKDIQFMGEALRSV